MPRLAGTKNEQPAARNKHAWLLSLIYEPAESSYSASTERRCAAHVQSAHYMRLSPEPAHDDTYMADWPRHQSLAPMGTPMQRQTSC